ncbi:transcriptional regulator [Pilimelia terevasa]|uniref:Transcriptional regulator n=1 Tax=Pilimelia terevasa TaxID=53372 RepID=A0A8J3FDT8_9ACTN|nr:GntR family transcriptional regulator [Pilimelia terevasa]GGK11421.1 transcriptional regulator [Pilimelia terevasa]
MATKYDRVVDLLRTRIEDGTYPAGTRLPAETALAEEIGFTVQVVRRALSELQAEGLIDRIHGRGTWVRQQRRPVERTTERYVWEKQRVHASEEERASTGATERDAGLEVHDLLFEAEYAEVEAPADLAATFEVSTSTKLLRRTYRTRTHGDAPFNVSTSYLPLDLVAANPALLDSTREPWPGGTQHQLFTVGVEVDRIIDKVTARPPRADEVAALDLPAGVAVLVLRKVSIDITGRVVEVADVVLPGDRTQLVYTTQLPRWSA